MRWPNKCDKTVHKLSFLAEEKLTDEVKSVLRQDRENSKKETFEKNESNLISIFLQENCNFTHK